MLAPEVAWGLVGGCLVQLPPSQVHVSRSLAQSNGLPCATSDATARPSAGGLTLVFCSAQVAPSQVQAAGIRVVGHAGTDASGRAQSRKLPRPIGSVPGPGVV